VISFEGSVNELLRIAIDHGVVNVNSREADLEQIFLEYYLGNDSDA
jgi:beta-exotoxin I transport system ATP-binding protein